MEEKEIAKPKAKLVAQLAKGRKEAGVQPIIKCKGPGAQTRAEHWKMGVD